MTHPILGSWFGILALLQLWGAVRTYPKSPTSQYENHGLARFIRLCLCGVTALAAYYLGTGN